MSNVPGHPSPAGAARSRLAWIRSWILVSSLGNVPFAYLIKELGTSTGVPAQDSPAVTKINLKIVLDIYPMRSYLYTHVDFIYDNNLPFAVIRHRYYII
jgi:hypothetical protein